MSEDYQLTSEQEKWAIKSKQGLSVSTLKQLIVA